MNQIKTAEEIIDRLNPDYVGMPYDRETVLEGMHEFAAQFQHTANQNPEQILREHMHGLTDEAFAEEITRWPLCEVPFAMKRFAAQFGNEWVKCSDERPTQDEQYNVCYKMPNGNWYVFTTGYSPFTKSFDIGNTNITHWQNLPQPPTP